MTLRYKFWHCAFTLFISWRSSGAEIALKFRKCQANVKFPVLEKPRACTNHTMNIDFSTKRDHNNVPFWTAATSNISCLINAWRSWRSKSKEKKVVLSTGGQRNQKREWRKQFDFLFRAQGWEVFPKLHLWLSNTNCLHSWEINDWNSLERSENVVYQVLEYRAASWCWEFSRRVDGELAITQRLLFSHLCLEGVKINRKHYPIFCVLLVRHLFPWAEESLH